MSAATAPTVMASIAPLSTLTSREGQVRLVQPSPEPRRASSTTRMASTPAAMAAAIGSRDGSGPISGTGAGPETGLVAVATVDFACAAASFAADARSPLVSASPAAAGRLRRSFLGRGLLRGFLRRGRLLRRLRGCLLGGCFLRRRLLLRLGRLRRGVACSSQAVARAAQVAQERAARARVEQRARRGPMMGSTRGPRRRRGLRTFVGSVLLVCHRAAPLQCRVSAGPAVAPIMPGRIWRYPVAASPAARASATAITASSASERDRDTTAVARWVRAAGSHNVRFRQPSSTSTTATAIFADNNRP